MSAAGAFASPSFSEPLDVEARIAAVPAAATVRGMFLSEIVTAVERAGQHVSRPGSPSSPGSYVSFKNYPVTDYMALQVEGARQLYPDEPLRQALRLLGRQVYPNFVTTMIGSAIFSVAGRSFARVAQLAGRAYSVSLEPGHVEAQLMKPRHVRVRLRDIWPFPDSFQIGVWEGAMQVCGARGPVLVSVLSPCDVDYDIAWTEGA